MMATSTDSRRKSQRRSVATKKKSYKEAFESEDEEDSVEAKLSKYLGDAESSGSDFEAELKKNSGSKKYEEEEEDEDDDNDASDVADEIVVEEKKKRAPSRWKKTKSSTEKVKNISSSHDLSLSSKLAAIKNVIVSEKEPSKKSCKAPQVKQRQFKSKMNPNSQLNLSESSDSEAENSGKKDTFGLKKPINHMLSSQSLSESSDGEGETAPKTVVSKPTSIIPSKHAKFEKKEIKEEDDDSEMASQLVNLVKSQTQISDFVENCVNLASTLKSTVKIEKTETVANIVKAKKPEKSTSGKSEKIKKGQSSKNKPKGSNDSSDIHDLLALGEGISMDSGDESEDEVDTKKSQTLASGSIEIAIEVPGKEKKKGKGFDVEAYLKRELAKVQREIALAVHQTHILCLIAHLRYLNSFTTMNVKAGDVSAKTTLSVALSAIPQLYCFKGKDLTLTSLAMFVRWFHDNFRVSFGITKDQFPSPLDEWIQHAFDMFKCESYEHLVIAFLCACRSLGWKARLVLHLEASSLKPKKDSDDDQKIKEASTGSSAKRKSSDAVTEQQSKKVKRDLENRVALKATSGKCSSNQKKSQAPSTKPSSSKERKSPVSKGTSKPKLRDSREESEGTKHKNEKDERSRQKKGQLASEITEKSTKSSKKGLQLSGKALKEASKRRSMNVDHSSSEENERPKDQKKMSAKLSSKKELVQKQGKGKTETQPQRSPVKTRRSSVGKVKPDKKISYTQASSDEDEEEEKKPSKAHRKSIPSKNVPKSKPPAESSDEFEIEAPVEKKVKRNIVQPPGKTVSYWIEVLTKSNGWVTVDMVRGRTNCTDDMEAVLIKPVLYIVACNASGSIKDVTKKYVNPSTYLTSTRKSRVSQEWLDGIFNPFQPNPTPEDTLENEKMEKHLMSAPLPTSVGAFKGHPLYVLTRHLLKFEGIYPENPPPLGFIHGEPVFARECVHTLHCRVTWLKEGRVVKIGEEPYKIVKARPKWDRMSGTVTKDMPLEVFGKWQTQLYVSPPAKDGKVPRNEYGNVDFFKPWMLPKGTVHLPITGLNRVAKKLNIDCPQAMTGWEFSGGSCHPVFDGFIVCEEVAETLMDAWNAEVEEKQRKDAEKREKRVLDNWKKLVKGLLMHQKIRKKYLGKDN